MSEQNSQKVPDPEPTPSSNTKRIQLPSRGIPYDGKLPDGWVEVSPMTTQEEQLLLSPRANRLKLLDTLIKRCLKTKEVPLEDMLVSDRFFLLLFIRNITYGPEYNLTSSCRKCGTKILKKLTLPEGLHVRILEPTDTEPFDVELPVSGKKLGLRLLRVKDEADVQRWADQRSLKGGLGEGDPTYIYRLSKYIVTIDGEEVNALNALSFCERMIGGDSAEMRSAIESHDCGASLLIEQVCKRCGHAFGEPLQFTSEFFRPGAVTGQG